VPSGSRSMRSTIPRTCTSPTRSAGQDCGSSNPKRRFQLERLRTLVRLDHPDQDLEQLGSLQLPEGAVADVLSCAKASISWEATSAAGRSPPARRAAEPPFVAQPAEEPLQHRCKSVPRRAVPAPRRRARPLPDAAALPSVRKAQVAWSSSWWRRPARPRRTRTREPPPACRSGELARESSRRISPTKTRTRSRSAPRRGRCAGTDHRPPILGAPQPAAAHGPDRRRRDAPGGLREGIERRARQQLRCSGAFAGGRNGSQGTTSGSRPSARHDSSANGERTQLPPSRIGARPDERDRPAGGAQREVEQQRLFCLARGEQLLFATILREAGTRTAAMPGSPPGALHPRAGDPAPAARKARRRPGDHEHVLKAPSGQLVQIST